MEGFGVHTSMWTMHWDRAGAERTIPAAAAYKMDFIEIALLNAAMIDPPYLLLDLPRGAALHEDLYVANLEQLGVLDANGRLIPGDGVLVFP